MEIRLCSKIKMGKVIMETQTLIQLPWQNFQFSMLNTQWSIATNFKIEN